MFPGIDPRQMHRMMKQLGVKQDDIDATLVIIKTKTTEIVFSQPQVSKVNMMGQETYQISGHAEERELSKTPELSEDDIKTVAEQANVSMKTAKDMLVKNQGDIAASILELTSQ